MPEYLQPAIDEANDDPSAIRDSIVEFMGVLMPGIQLADGSPMLVFIESMALEIAETRRLATGEGQTFERIARWLFEHTYGIPVQNPTFAAGASTWTAIDTLGPYLIPAGTEFTLAGAGGERIGFETVDDVTIPVGASTTATGGVAFIAKEPGIAGNGLQNDPQLETRLDFVNTLVVTGPTSGGVDGETDEEYLDRAARRRRRDWEGLVLPEDFAGFAADWPGVERALVLDQYDPVAATFGHEGELTIVPIDVNGQPVPAPVVTEMLAAMQDMVMTGFIVHSTTPTYTPVAVVFAATSWPGWDAAATEVAAEQAVASFLHPANHGRPPGGSAEDWLQETVIYRNDVIGVLENVSGIRRVVSLTINGSSTADLTLAGVAPLPSAASTVAGTVTPSA